ncbi:MAG: gamma-glutamylcyclotransferase family protein [Pseudohongiella sp.]|nr:gamma-glutamylcyclotransferase family protein [Pseudohongiella sp.]MDP2125913.1 gamma-glutamylcyclotransferase family protein [Pseudohongiella sp.]
MSDKSKKVVYTPMLVAVYGTLKRGLSNHHLMQSAQYLGEDYLDSITLYDLGPYPGAKAELSAGIVIEVYAVDALQLGVLDELEDYNAAAPEQGMYNRKLFPTKFGEAWVYLYNPAVDGLAAQRRGSWLPGQAHVLQASTGAKQE